MEVQGHPVHMTLAEVASRSFSTAQVVDQAETVPEGDVRHTWAKSKLSGEAQTERCVSLSILIPANYVSVTVVFGEARSEVVLTLSDWQED